MRKVLVFLLVSLLVLTTLSFSVFADQTQIYSNYGYDSNNGGWIYLGVPLFGDGEYIITVDFFGVTFTSDSVYLTFNDGDEPFASSNLTFNSAYGSMSLEIYFAYNYEFGILIFTAPESQQMPDEVSLTFKEEEVTFIDSVGTAIAIVITWVGLALTAIMPTGVLSDLGNIFIITISVSAVFAGALVIKRIIWGS